LDAEGGFLHALLQFLNVLRRQLRTVDLDRQLVELRGQRERRQIVGVVGARISTASSQKKNFLHRL
jgi:hypothetical protein